MLASLTYIHHLPLTFTGQLQLSGTGTTEGTDAKFRQTVTSVISACGLNRARFDHGGGCWLQQMTPLTVRMPEANEQQAVLI